jgi:hypothetical protein
MGRPFSKSSLFGLKIIQNTKIKIGAIYKLVKEFWLGFLIQILF